MSFIEIGDVEIEIIESIPGPAGPPGAGANTPPQAFPFAAAMSVTCNHNMNRQPASVEVVDSGGNRMIAGIAYPTTNQVVVTFSAAQTGTVYIA